MSGGFEIDNLSSPLGYGDRYLLRLFETLPLSVGSINESVNPAKET
jgi:hypothetical protein